MMLLREHLLWKMKYMTVEVKVAVYPLLYAGHAEFIMLLPRRTFPSFLPLQEPQLHTSHTTNLYDGTFHSALLMMTSIQQFTTHLSTTPHYCRPLYRHLQSTVPMPYPITSPMKKKKKISRQSLWMMTIGLQYQLQRETHASMNIHSNIPYIATVVHITWITTVKIAFQHHTLIPWTSMMSLITKM